MQNPGAFARASIEQKTTESKTLEKKDGFEAGVGHPQMRDYGLGKA
jgi:hypothetical protein